MEIVRIVLADGVALEVPKAQLAAAGLQPKVSVDDMPTMRELKRRYVEHVLKLCNGNKSKAARVLGLSRRSVQLILGRAA